MIDIRRALQADAISATMASGDFAMISPRGHGDATAPILYFRLASQPLPRPARRA